MSSTDTDSLPIPTPSQTGSIRSCSQTSKDPQAQPPGLDKQCPSDDGGPELFDKVNLTSDLEGLHSDGIEAWNALDKIPTTNLGDTLLPTPDFGQRSFSYGAGSNLDMAAPGSSKPFYKWMKTLHKRSARRREISVVDEPIPPHFTVDGASSPRWRPAHHRRSSSGSSFGFVTAVKSASVSLTSVSLLARSRKNTVRSSRARSRTDRSSRASVSGARLSEDSACPDRQMAMDPAVLERSLQRRRILEELITTEEGYIGDVRFLMNVCLTRNRRCPFCLLT
jgi:hypothetical protein